MSRFVHGTHVLTAGESFDRVVAGARIVDGCGNPWYRGDLGLRGRRIEAIGPPYSLRGADVIDAGDRYATPGFVDPHTHSDVAMLLHRRAESALRQGVTTHVTGNCGMSAAPIETSHVHDLIRLWDHYGWAPAQLTWEWRSFAEYLGELESAGLGINVVPLVGHAALRIAAMGFERRAPSALELEHMRRLLAESMTAGAFGLSTGLVYPPGCYATQDEIVSLCAVVARYRGLYTSHVRGERETIIEADREAIDIGRQAGVPVEISHNAPKFGAASGADANLGLVEEARRHGLDVTVDNDLHTELAVRLSRALPQPVLDLGHDALLALLRTEEGRRRLQADVRDERYPGAGYTGLLKHDAYERIVVLEAPGQPDLAGSSIAAIAAGRGRPAFDTLLDLILEEDDRVVGIFEYIDPQNVRAVLKHPAAMVCSDGLVMSPLDGEPSAATYLPCSYGEYPGILERLVRDEGLLTLEETIRKMTSFPAQRFGLFYRGVLRPGMIADIVVFDLDRVRDRATNPFPHGRPFVNIPPRYPVGIDEVLVGGEVAISGSRHTGVLAGRLIRR
jgi:N-acyl-D-amino-acid deacylase